MGLYQKFFTAKTQRLWVIPVMTAKVAKNLFLKFKTLCSLRKPFVSFAVKVFVLLSQPHIITNH
jgi:hypothetical protein